MKKSLLLWSLLSAFTTIAAFAQDCSKLMISKYVEGYGNNRALEIYNPTPNALNLNGYSVGRFSNGGTSFEGIQLPSYNLAPYATYVVVLDKRDSLATGLETPVWNGYQKWDVCIDQLTGLPILDANGDTVFCVQYDANGLHLYGNTYRDFLDLQGRADVFLCPNYDQNNAMYFNGNDAVAIISGTTVAADGSNILDVVGVIGIDPGESWTTASGSWITKDRTLVRKPDVKRGVVPVHVLGDTLPYHEWTLFPKNTFEVIKRTATAVGATHDCACDPNFVGTRKVPTFQAALFPNPIGANEPLVLQTSVAIRSVEVFNSVGQRVFVAFGDAQRFDLVLPASLPMGVYVLRAVAKDGAVASQKLVVQP